MRLSEKKQYRGYFWFPGWPDPEDRIPGELVIDTNGSMLLNLEYPNWNKDMLHTRPRTSSGFIKQKRICGVIGNEFVILLECKRISYPYSSYNPSSISISKDTYSLGCCIMGPYYEQNFVPEEANIDFNDDVEFDTLYFSIDRLVNFFNAGEIVREEIPTKYIKIEWHKKSIEIPSCDGFTLKVENDGFLGGNPNYPDRMEMTIKDRVIWVLKFRAPLPLEDCINKIEHIKEFFAFIFNRSVGITYLAGSLQEVAFWLPGQEEHKEAIRHKIHYQIDHLDPTTSALKREHAPILYRDFIDEAGEGLFGKYLSSYLEKRASDEWFDNVFSSFLYNMPGGNLMHLFKELISTLEYVHHEQKMCGKKPVERLKVLIEGSGFSCDGDLIKRVRKFLQNSSDSDDPVLALYREFVQNNLDSDEAVLAVYAVYVRNTFAHGEKRDVDFSITKKLHLWLWKITSFHLLSMVKEGDELNRRIVEKSHRR